VQENLERKKTNKSKTMSTRDKGDLFYWGSVLENLIPIEESTKDESFSTLSLSPPITKTGELFFFFSTRDRSLRKANHKDKGSC
jgi:spore cortex formation protein SpoVR/YcgB (stage V sporulation)